MSVASLAKENIARAAGETIGLTVDAEWVELANPKAGSHLALPCFRFAKDLSKSPQDIAEMLASQLEVEGVSKIEAMGPYVNFWIDSNLLASGAADNARLLNDAELNGKVAVVEFLSPNLAKPLSVGHLRNVFQGRALTRVYKNAGYKVITDNHIGDWGTVFGMWVVGFEKFSSDEKLNVGGVEELGRMYVEMRKALKDEEGEAETPLADAVQDWLKKLESGDEQATRYHDKFSEISLSAITDQMKEFAVVFDYNLGESHFVARGKEMVNELVASGGAVRNEDGSVVIPLEDQGIETPMLIEKSNGAALYHTSDIATIEYRENEWDPDLVVYVVGAEQQFHFKQLFAANQKFGWSDAELIHHWYGLIEELNEDGKREKMSSRKNAIYLKDLLQRARDKAREIAPDDMSDDDVDRIGQGALTFQEFSASHTLNTLFDWDAMFSLSGFSGPYVQYAAVRIQSVLAKNDVGTDMPDSYDWSAHSDLLWQLCRYEMVVNEATESREYHKIATYSYELARNWNRFYETFPILDAEDQDRRARLWLAKTIGEHLQRSLYLLGIKIPSRM